MTVSQCAPTGRTRFFSWASHQHHKLTGRAGGVLHKKRIGGSVKSSSRKFELGNAFFDCDLNQALRRVLLSHAKGLVAHRIAHGSDVGLHLSAASVTVETEAHCTHAVNDGLMA